MGIRNLNRHLYENCSGSSIRKINIEDMRNKTIVIDTSIYIYKYLRNEKLEENFIKLIELFIKHHIRPIFVFDGKSPAMKSNLRKERSKSKKIAETEYNDIKDCSFESQKRRNELKQKFIRVKGDDIVMLKRMMKHYDIETVQCEWEADSICANYVKKGIAWGCLSDDMDMLVYGCCRVIREFSFHTCSAQLYTLPLILKDLNMSLSLFRDIMVISGTDYNSSNLSHVTLSNTLLLHEKFSQSSIGKRDDCFYKWLLENTTYIKNYDELINIRKIFE